MSEPKADRLTYREILDIINAEDHQTTEVSEVFSKKVSEELYPQKISSKTLERGGRSDRTDLKRS